MNIKSTEIISDSIDDHASDDGWRYKLPTPEPSAGLAAYNRERKIALATSPRRLWNYIRFMRSSRRATTANYLPVKLDVENVSRCNFRCTMCQVSEWTNQKRADDMSFEDFKELIDSQYGLVEIKLQGMGEPILGGETFFKMINYARKKHIWVRTVTNASMLHLRDNYKNLIDTGVNEVQVSIDGATKEVFESIRQGSKFQVVKANCKLLNDYCHEQGVNVTKMWTVVQKGNVHELPDLVEFAHETGFKDMTFSLNLSDWGQEKWTTTNQAVTVDDTLDREFVEKLLRRASELGIRLSFWNVSSKYSTSSPERICPWPFERSYVSSDMRVVPCCMIANPDASDLGSAKDFTTSWNNADYQEFRKAHLEGRIPNVCKGCYEPEVIQVKAASN